MKQTVARNGESRVETGNPAAAILAAFLAWAERGDLPRDQRELFDRQAERLADGDDTEAWIHPQNGTVVPRGPAAGVRPWTPPPPGRDQPNAALRGGVMYAVAKHYRTPPPIAGTEHAAVVALWAAGELVRERLHQNETMVAAGSR